MLPIPPQFIPEADRKWAEISTAFKTAQLSLPEDPSLINELKRILVLSDFFAKSCRRFPHLLADLIDSSDYRISYRLKTYVEKLASRLAPITESETDAPAGHSSAEASLRKLVRRLQPLLREFRLREMLRIAWRDLGGRAPLAETLRDLSALADTCLDQTLSVLDARMCELFGTPRSADGEKIGLAVIGMGKLGGFELNFSSDVDLIFAYPEAGTLKGGAKTISLDDFFARLCRALIQAISEQTADGFVFRVDTRLRPDGENGPIVLSFDNMEYYYQYQGREWERYAWIKARALAGDTAAGRRLIRRLKPFVYRRYLDYGVFESLRGMKRKIELEIKRRGMAADIKLGPGGIREIEFFCQIFQLLRGGVIPSLQKRNLLIALDRLRRERLVPVTICADLQEAYRFLRATENRLQAYADQQTHKLPSDSNGRLRLASAMGFDDWEAFWGELQAHLKKVHAHFESLLESKEDASPAHGDQTPLARLQEIWHNLSDKLLCEQLLQGAGFDRPQEALAALSYLHDAPETRALSGEGRLRLDRLVPLTIREAGSSKRPARVMQRIAALLKNIERRTTYLSLLSENPLALQHLVKLVSQSSWIANYLAQHPVLLDELLYPRQLYMPADKSILAAELRQRLQRISPEDLELQIEQLCIFKQINTLRVAAADVSGVLPLMRVSDYLSYIAEAILAQVVERAWTHLVQKHGRPVCRLNGAASASGFAVIGYGKLGGLELGYASDLDLVFLHSGAAGLTRGGAAPIDNTQFFTRLGQRVLHMLGTYTAAGALYETDMRLRPSGSSGILVSHYETFHDYQLNEAWTWEHQALLRARAISGDPGLIAWFQNAREQVLTRFRDPADLRAKVIDIRTRLLRAGSAKDPQIFDLKADPGGMVDIEFLVQYLILLKAHQDPRLVRWTDNVRLLYSLAQAGILDEETAYFLRCTYLVYRSAAHRLSLDEKPAAVDKNRFENLRAQVRSIWTRYLA